MQYLVYPLELDEGLTYTMDSLVPRPFPPTRKGLETKLHHGHVSHVFVKLHGSADLVIKGLT